MSLAQSNQMIGIIGVGVMGEALLSGLLNTGFPKAQIIFYEKRKDRAAEITSRYGVSSSEINELCRKCDVVLLVTKPQDLGSLLDETASNYKKDVLLISFVAGKKINFISSRVPSSKVIRVMPNTPILVGKGMSAVSLGSGVNEEAQSFILEFLNSVGKAIVVDESLQDAVTATSGSGPAYFFAFVEEMIHGAILLGLSDNDAKVLTIQTIVGAAEMLQSSGKDPKTLRENVTSPNGTTAAALAKFNEGEIGKLISDSMKAARDRSQELA